MNRSRIRGVVFCFFILLCAYSLARFELTHGLTHFIPSEHEAELVELSLELVQSRLSRRMILSLGGGPERDNVAKALGDYLASHPEVSWVETGFHEASAGAFFEIYFDRRFYLTSASPSKEIPGLFETDGLIRAADDLKSRLAGPPIRGASRTAAEDPLGLFERILNRVREARPVLTGENGNFVSSDGEHAIVLLELISSPFDSERQKPLLQDLEAEFDRLNSLHGGGLVLEQSGVNRISVATEQSVRSDVFFVSTASIILVCGLFLFVYRSFRQLAIVAMVPAAGFLSALAITLSLPDALHGITLAFGFVLIGVTIDYPIHLLNHHALRSGERSVEESVRNIRPSLVLSAATTTLAFLSLALSEFPGLREMGIFAAIGVPVALLISLYAIPAFLPVGTAPTAAQEALARAFVRIVEGLETRRKFLVGAGFGLGLVLLLGLPQLRWADDPSDLMNPDPRALAESERVRERVGDFDGGQFAVGLAPDSQLALSLNEKIHARLEEARAAGEIKSLNSLHTFLWSEELQLQNLDAFRRIDQRDARLDGAFRDRGFRPGAFDAFGRAIDAPSREPLRVENLENSPLGRVLDLLVEMDEGFAVVTHLEEVTSPERVRARLADLENAHLIDQEKIVADVYRGYRKSTTWMVGLGSAVAFGVLLARYRSPLRGALAAIPAAVGALGALAVFGISGHPVNVIGAVSLLVVLGMGVDYGIFCVDSVEKPEGAGPTLASLMISWLTSVFVFGVLALSGQPALRSIGLTASVGISLSLLAAPCVVVMARRSLREPGEG